MEKSRRKILLERSALMDLCKHKFFDVLSVVVRLFGTWIKRWLQLVLELASVALGSHVGMFTSELFYYSSF